MPLDEEIVVRELWRQRIRLLALIEVIVRDEHIAEDVFQEISVAAIRKRGEINDASHLEAWLRQAVRFHAIAAVRKSSRRPMIFDDRVLDRIEGIWARHDAEMAGTGGERGDALRTCLDRLSPYARQLIELRYGEGISGNRLADAVGRQLNTVYVALTRTHRTLAECIRRQLGADAEVSDGGTDR